MKTIDLFKTLSIMFSGFMLGNLIIGDPKFISYSLIKPVGINWALTVSFNIIIAFIPLFVVCVFETIKEKNIK